MVTPDHIEDARRRLAGLVRETPVIHAERLSDRAGVAVVLKAENLQLTGSFKIRGATNAIMKLPPERLAAGVVAASAGNHAQAVALAARRAGTRATLCIPVGAPVAKLDAVRRYGGEVRLVDGSYDDAQRAAHSLARDEDRPLIHAFADPDVVAGQGTLGIEIAEAVPDIATLVVPLGGGGLISGVAIAIKAMRPNVRVVGVQAEACSPYLESLAARRPVGARSARTIADGIAVKRPAELTLGLVQEWVDEVVTVSEDEIAQAMVHLIDESKLVVEGAGAASAGAVYSGRIELPQDGACCVVLSGGNVDASLLAECIRMGETVSARRTVLKSVVPDSPGALAALLDVVAKRGGNVIDVAHLREGIDLHVRETLVRLVIQTRDGEHGATIAEAIRAEGFSLEVES